MYKIDIYACTIEVKNIFANNIRRMRKFLRRIYAQKIEVQKSILWVISRRDEASLAISLKGKMVFVGNLLSCRNQRARAQCNGFVLEPRNGG